MSSTSLSSQRTAATVTDKPPVPPDSPAQAAPPATKPFWRKPLEELTREEWESLCDGCGRCCLVKLEDEDTGEIHFTDIACSLFDAGSCRCGNYPQRKSIVPDCVQLTPAEVRSLRWLPPTCAYKLVADGKDLRWWHPLISGRPETVHEAGISVRGRVGGHENEVRFEDWPDHIRDWPNREPRPRKPKV
jgi:uncharacterized cysteine cluster protein YcgN (CxxCxxCC family)